MSTITKKLKGMVKPKLFISRRLDLLAYEICNYQQLSMDVVKYFYSDINKLSVLNITEGGIKLSIDSNQLEVPFGNYLVKNGIESNAFTIIKMNSDEFNKLWKGKE